MKKCMSLLLAVSIFWGLLEINILAAEFDSESSTVEILGESENQILIREGEQTFRDYFPDEVFALVVANALGKEAEDVVTVEELEQVRSLSYNGTNKRKVANLTGIHYLKNLTVLHLNSNQITELPVEFCELVYLETLSLVANQLQEIPEEFGKLTHLRTLFLSGNKLTKLPNTIGSLTHLTFFYLSNNRLTELPDEIGNLSDLTHFYAYSNQLATLPITIGGLTKLNTLDLGQNRLQELPQSLANATQLQYFDVRGNQIAELPEEITRLLQLNSNWQTSYGFEKPFSHQTCDNVVFAEVNDVTTLRKEDILPQILVQILTSNHVEKERQESALFSVQGKLYSFYELWNDIVCLDQLFPENGDYKIVIVTESNQSGKYPSHSNFDEHHFNYNITVNQQPKPQIGTVTARHILVDINGKETMQSEETISGNVGDSYNIIAKLVAGYTLREKPANAQGKIGQTPVVVTFYYDEATTPRPPVIGTVTERHVMVRKDGTKILYKETVHRGVATGDKYSLVAEKIAGYKLRKLPVNSTGTFSNISIMVTFYYDQE